MVDEPARLAAMESPAQMEPLMPRKGERRLEDLAVELVAKASALAGHLHPVVQRSIGTLVRSMNCYYSNLIEGHDTHPRDIDRALARDYSVDPTRRALQLEAVAHIELQAAVDEGRDETAHPTSTEYILWLHREFCRRLPDELLWIEDPETKRRVRVQPGVLRDGDVAVGRHFPPSAGALPSFMRRFEQGYAPENHSRVRQLLAIPASHHRLLWIHPFYDGNGRVARLMSHALFKRSGVGSSLWSAARGLARDVATYKRVLMAADESRRNDWDGRGNLSEAALTEFCEFFLKVCIEQVNFMESLLQPAEWLRRLESFVEDEVRARRLPKGAFPILRETVLVGEIERGHAGRLTGHAERRARTVVATLLDRGLLVSGGPKAPLRLGFPIDVVDRWFPRLYPTTA
jgi:Fic family protein